MKRSPILFLVALCLGAASPVFAATCTITDTNSLQYCLDQGAAVDYFDLQSDLTCSGGDCCGTTGALINLNGRSGVTFQGNGHVITRTSQQTVCPALSIVSASGIVIQSLRIDEDESTPRCLGDAACSASIQIIGSTSITMEDVGLYNSKEIGIHVKGVNGYTFNNSAVSNAGVIGILVGENAATSDNIWITNSVIAHTGTNGLTLIGMMGDPSGAITNVVRNNVFDTNHILGAYYTDAFPEGGPFNNGGQIYVAHARSVAIEYNVIADGRCDNCDGFSGYATIPAFELGAQPASGGGPLDYVLFHANKIRNTYGPAFFKNSGAQISATSAIWENDMRGVTSFRYPVGFSGPTFGTNPIGDYSPSANSYGYLSNFIQKMSVSGYLVEANWTWQHPGGLLRATYGLLGYPRARTSMKPIYRCLAGSTNDFPSLDPNCEGAGFSLHSILGYSYEPDFPGAVPLYRCWTGSQHFVSTDVNCEGATNVLHLGYTVVQ